MKRYRAAATGSAQNEGELRLVDRDGSGRFLGVRRQRQPPARSVAANTTKPAVLRIFFIILFLLTVKVDTKFEIQCDKGIR